MIYMCISACILCAEPDVTASFVLSIQLPLLFRIRDYVLEWRRTRALIWRWTVFVAAIILLAGLFVRFPRCMATVFVQVSPYQSQMLPDL